MPIKEIWSWVSIDYGLKNGKRKINADEIKMDLKDKLYGLFDERLQEFYKDMHIDDIQDSDYGPFIPFVWEPNYTSADKKIIFIGQQTNGWTSLKEAVEKEHNVEYLSSMSKDFKHAENYNSPFWYFIHSINEKFNSNRLAFYWTNLFKTESKNYQPGENIMPKTKEHLDTLSEEIKILDPDMAVFLTGPLYDQHLEYSLPETSLSPFFKDIPERHMASVEGLDCKAIRTYHPAYLRRRKIFDDHLEKTVEFLKD